MLFFIVEDYFSNIQLIYGLPKIKINVIRFRYIKLILDLIYKIVYLIL